MLPKINIQDFILRLPNLEDAGLLRSYLLKNKDHLSKWEPVRESDYYDYESSRNKIIHAIQSFKNKKAVHFYIYNKTESEIVGNISFSNIILGVFLACNLGYAISMDYEGKGVMFKSLRVTINYMFEEFGLHRIMANYMPENSRSEKLLLRLGFEKEGYAKSYLKINGKWQDHVLTSLINAEHKGNE